MVLFQTKKYLTEELKKKHPDCHVKNLSTMSRPELLTAHGGDLAKAQKDYQARQAKLSAERPHKPDRKQVAKKKELVQEVKSIGKYGQKLTQVMKRANLSMKQQGDVKDTINDIKLDIKMLQQGVKAGLPAQPEKIKELKGYLKDWRAVQKKFTKPAVKKDLARLVSIAKKNEKSKEKPKSPKGKLSGGQQAWIKQFAK